MSTDPGPMHASIWRLTGDPQELLRRYDAMLAEIGDEPLLFHACLVTDDGLLIVDMCPTKERFDNFWAGDWLRGLLHRHGLPMPEIEDHPVHGAFAGGRRVVAE